MTRTKKVLATVGAVGALLIGAGVVVPRLLWGDGVDYSKAVSIQTVGAYQDAALLEKAWALPVAQAYRAGLDFQSNGSFCGPASLVNVMRSLGSAADQGTVLADTGVSTVMGAIPGGLSLDQLAGLVEKKLGKKVTALRDLDLAAFREQLRRTNDPGVRFIVNFHRGPLFGKGGGHHSPIAGYLADEDLVFVLDVNASYRPWLVKPERLLEAMNTVDKTSGQKRGLLRIETGAAPQP